MRAVRSLSAVAIAGWTGLALALQSCGVLSSGDCGDKAICVEADGAIGEELSNLEVLEAAPENSPNNSPDVASVDASSEDAAPAVDVARVDVRSEEAASPDVRSDAVSVEDVGIADVTSDDIAIADGTSQDATAGDAVSEDVVSDAGGGKGSDAACVTSSCPSCVPYFLQCCKADGTCGCSLLFPPGPCN